MRILVENGAYHGQNMGDVAMLQVAISRLNQLWNSPTIEVLTSAPELLLNYCPTVQPLILENQDNYFPCLAESLQRLLPTTTLQQSYSSLEWQLHTSLPSLTSPLLQRKLQRRTSHDRQFKTLVNAVQQADLVIASGGGYLTDAFSSRVKQTFSIFNVATWLRKPTALLGQGLGPLKAPELTALAHRVFPRVTFIALRENQAGMTVLKEFGVDPNRIMVTGDDAIELAYNARQLALGHGIGVNLRVANYSEFDASASEAIQLVLQQLSQTYDAPLLPVPISQMEDPPVIQALIASYDPHSDGGRSLNTPMQVIDQVGHCRVVVTGSYHGGVFALAQGIPVVGLVKSQYYIDKFQGLAHQFGMGCEVISMDDSQMQDKLYTAVGRLWHQAETMRAALLDAAYRQVILSQTAYSRLYDLVESAQARM